MEQVLEILFVCSMVKGLQKMFCTILKGEMSIRKKNLLADISDRLLLATAEKSEIN